MSPITLLTDFGLKDEYVGVMKGVILGLNPDARIVDLSHGVDPQDVRQAAFLLKSAYAYFPHGTIHIAVVDPGVGSQRAILAARFEHHTFLAPDNGLLTGIWGEKQPELLVRVENRAICLHPISHCFHGRDIFAPVAAQLSLGLNIIDLGPPMAWDQALRFSSPTVGFDSDGQLRGQVIAIDRFGNLVTNISSDHVAGVDPGSMTIYVGDHCIEGLSTSYSQASIGQALALIGSRDLMEIAVNRSDAALKLKVSKGAEVFITLKK